MLWGDFSFCGFSLLTCVLSSSFSQASASGFSDDRSQAAPLMSSLSFLILPACFQGLLEAESQSRGGGDTVEGGERPRD